MSIKEYNQKRKFTKGPRGEPTSEPIGKEADATVGNRASFMVHKHAASHLHYDLRIELDGVLKSWAIPKGPSLNITEQRLAVYVEDHPLAYAHFEGKIPEGNYGAGSTLIWDAGTYTERQAKTRTESDQNIRDGLIKGKITFFLFGQKLKGEFALVRLKEGKNWLLLKKRDKMASYKDILLENRSVASGLRIEELAELAEAPHWLRQEGEKQAELKRWQVKKTDLALAKSKAGSGKLFSFMLPSVSDTPIEEKNWLFLEQIKGFRVLLTMKDGHLEIKGKGRVDIATRFAILKTFFADLASECCLEGQIFVLDDKGEPSRQLLLQYQKGNKAQLRVSIDDILTIDGKDIRSLPFKTRRQQLSVLTLPHGVVINPLLTSYDGVHEVKAYHPEGVYKSGVSTACVIFVNQIEQEKTSNDPKLTLVPKVSFEIIARRFELEDLTIEMRGSDNIKYKDGPLITHTQKILWPEEKITKGDLVEYYAQVGKIMVPYVKDRPISMNRHPHGVLGQSFYQKDLTGYLPPWLKTHRVTSSRKDFINFCLCQDVRSLLYIANLACIEIHPWLSRVGSLDTPDYCVIDLDPDDNNSFDQVIEVAQQCYLLLEQIGAKGYLKTSGATGLHIYIPVRNMDTYETVRSFGHDFAAIIHSRLPKTTSIERNKNKRLGRIYIDYMQNARGQTLAAPYCVRPVAGAQTSAPLQWSELKEGLHPSQFTLRNTVKRLEKIGDIWSLMLTEVNELDRLLVKLAKAS